MKVSFDGIGEMSATFYSNGAIDGYPVKMSADAEVKNAAAGEGFIGIAAAPGDEYTGVILEGCVSVPYSGTAPARGITALVADGNGGVKTGAAGASYRVLSASGGIVCFIL